MSQPVWLDQLCQDIGYGLRMLRRNPGFSAVVILTLALGIGMNTAIFSVMDAVLLHHLPYPDARRLIWIANYDTGYESETDLRLLPGDYSVFQQQARSFESMAAYSNQDLALVHHGDAATERIASITGDFWSMTGAQPALGRLFHPGEPQAMVLSWRFFERRFGNDPHAIGKTVTLDGHPFEILGVLPAHFRFLLPQFIYPDDERRDIDAYIAVPNAALNLPVSAYRADASDKLLEKLGPTPLFVWVIGKLKPDIPFKRGQAELQAIYQRLIGQRPSVYHTHSALRVQPLQEKLVRHVRPALIVLAGAAGFVLLIVCVNIANLLFARASTRQSEIAVRRALGAGPWRLTRQFLSESVLFALVGAAAGVALAIALLSIITQLGSRAIPRLSETTIDGWVLLFTLALSILSAVLFGLAPAASFRKAHVHDRLKQQRAAGGSRMRGLLVALEIALAVVLLSGAGLMLKSFWRMNAFPPGFAPDKMLVMNVSLSGPQYRSWSQQHAYIDEFFRRIESVPGVQATGIHCSSFHTAIQVQGLPPDNQLSAAIEYVSGGYLQSMGVPLLAGHWPTENESLDVVVVNESFARRAASGSPIGKHIHASLLSATIAGIVPDLKISQLDAEPLPQIYAAYQMSPRISFVTAILRTSFDPAPLIPEIRKRISAIDRNVPVYRIETLERELGSSIAPRRFNMFLLSSFAAAALLLALIGLYGLIAYSVARRTQEIGVRMALGARRFQVVGILIREAMTITLLGLAVGSLSALGFTRLMSSLLYGVKPNDPPTLLAVAGFLAATALLASRGAARRAACVDPLAALRHE